MVLNTTASPTYGEIPAEAVPGVYIVIVPVPEVVREIAAPPDVVANCAVVPVGLMM